MVYYGLTREERRKRLESFKLKPTDEVFDLTDDNFVISPTVVKREPRKYTVIELIDLSKDSDSDEEPSYKKHKIKKEK